MSKTNKDGLQTSHNLKQLAESWRVAELAAIKARELADKARNDSQVAGQNAIEIMLKLHSLFESIDDSREIWIIETEDPQTVVVVKMRGPKKADLVQVTR